MPPKTEAQKKRMVASAAMKKYKDFSAIQLSRELKRLQTLEKKQTQPANVIRIAVVKKLISKVSDKEISATEARQALKKKVPEKKQVTKKEFEKARKDLKDKKVSKPEKKKEPKKTPPPDKQTLQAVLGIMANVGKENSKKSDTEKLRETLGQFSRGQLATATKKAYEDQNEGKTITVKRGNSKEQIIDYIIDNKLNVIKFLASKKGRKDPKRQYIIEGFYLIDEDDGSIPMGLEEYGFTFYASYPSGLVALEASLTRDQLRKFVKEYQEDYEDYSRLFSEDKRTRRFVWDGLTS